MSKCNCQKPPGGGVECPPNSLAICRRENNECRGYCRHIPSGLQRRELDNWILRIIKDDGRSLHQVLSFADQQILRNKEFIIDGADGRQIIIRFDFPDSDETTGAESFNVIEF